MTTAKTAGYCRYVISLTESEESTLITTALESAISRTDVLSIYLMTAIALEKQLLTQKPERQLHG